jgi:NodT family efflux transporter outer membrane factor (OMF) lipoprotein
MKRILKYPAVLLPLFLINAGCALHRSQKIELPVTPPESFAEQKTPASSQKIPVGRWWATFDDSTLNTLMDSTFARNLDLAQAFARLEQLEAVSRSSRAARFPILEIKGRSSKGKQSNFFGSMDTESHSLSASAGFELDLWQKLKSRHKAGNLEAAASMEDLKALYLTISATAADLYFLILEQRSQLALVESTIASFEETTALVERRYYEGIVPAVDVYQARQNLSAVKARKPLYVAQLATAEHALSILVGHYPGREVPSELSLLPKTPEAFPAGLPSELLAARPDVAANLLRLKAADARIGAAVADRFPSFNLLGDYGRSKSVYGGNSIISNFWNMIANLALPVIDGGRRRAEVDRTRAVFKERLGRFQQAVLQAFGEVENALVANRTTEERIEQLEERVGSTSASLRLALDRYSLGLTDYLPVLTSQGLDFESRSQLLSARRQLFSDRISFARALGGNWMESEINQRLSVK